MKALFAISAVVALMAGCGGGSGSADAKVWCAAPGEKVDAQFKQEYPELYISKQACDALNK